MVYLVSEDIIFEVIVFHYDKKCKFIDPSQGNNFHIKFKVCICSLRDISREVSLLKYLARYE
jgi:hypothetical protein